ncbi:hypothetical protein B7463_g6912, partial [Scytalidium lignicola]
MPPKASGDSLLNALMKQPDFKLDYTQLGKDLGISSDGARKRMTAFKKKIDVAKAGNDPITDSLLDAILKQPDLTKINFPQLGKDLGITSDGARKRLTAFKKRVAAEISGDTSGNGTVKEVLAKHDSEGDDEEELEAETPKTKKGKAAARKNTLRKRAGSEAEEEDESPTKKRVVPVKGKKSKEGGIEVQQRGRRAGSTKRVTAVLEQEMLERQRMGLSASSAAVDENEDEDE